MGFFSKSPRPYPRTDGMGLFGKVPARGDFIAQGLPRTFQSSLENWIRGGLSLAQTDPNWHAAYMSSPIWQFAFAPGFLDDRAWCGVIMPSVDTVGRNFPLVLALQTDSASATFFGRAQGLAQRVLAPDFTDVDGWMADVRALGTEPDTDDPDRQHAPSHGARLWTVDVSGERMAGLGETSALPELYSRMIGAGGGDPVHGESLL